MFRQLTRRSMRFGTFSHKLLLFTKNNCTKKVTKNIQLNFVSKRGFSAFKFADSSGSSSGGDLYQKWKLITPIFCGIGGLYFVIKTFFLENYVNRFHVFRDQNGNQITMNRRLLEELHSIVEEANISADYKEMALSMFVFSDKLEPVIYSSYFSRYGVYFALPIFLNYYADDSHEEMAQNVAQFVAHFRLDESRLAASMIEQPEDDRDYDPHSASSQTTIRTEMDRLRESLILSRKARRFLLLSLLHSASLPGDPYGHTVAFFTFPLAAFQLAKYVGASVVPMIGAIAAGMGLSAAAIVSMDYYEQRYGYEAVFQYEIRKEAEHEAAEDEMKSKSTVDEREELLAGARELMHKLRQLRTIVAKYSRDQTTSSSIWHDFNYGKLYPIDERLRHIEQFASDHIDV